MDVIQLVIAAVARATISTIPLFVLVATITLLGRRWLAPWARHMLWSLVLIRLMLPISAESLWSLQPSIAKEIELSTGPVKVSPRENWVHFLSFGEPDLSTLPAGYHIPGDPRPNPVAASDGHHNAFELVVPLGLLGGTLIVGLWTGVTSIRLWRWTRKGKSCDREDLRLLVSEGQRRLGVSGTVQLWMVPGLSGPATYGWWRPTILLPDDLDAWSPLELKHVIWHELAHIRRYDVLLNWGLALVRAVHWWNPMFWMAQRAWLAERELACDALVLAQLEDQGARQYGETLLKFIERLSAIGQRPSFASPGFVSFWGRKHEAKRRLAQLTKLAQPERTWCVWISMALIAISALVGLSDAAPRPQEIRMAPLELPAETSWNVLRVKEEGSSEPRTTVDYPLGPILDRLCADLPQQRVRTMWQIYEMISLAGHRPFDPSTEAAQDPSKHWTTMRLGEIVVVHGTAHEHAEVKRLLELCETDGLAHIRKSVTQVCTEFRIATTSMSLAELLPGIKGQVIADERLLLDPNEAMGLAETTSHTPTFQAVLTLEEMKSFMRRLQQDTASKLMYAPKVTTYSGQAATIVSLTRRPLVTGLQYQGGGIVEPHVSVVDNGETYQTKATAADDRQSIQLAVSFQESRLTSVDSWHTSFEGRVSTVQLPHVARSLVSVTASIPNGHTLLLVPLRRNDRGQLQLHMFSAELFPEDTYQDEVASEE